MAFKSYDRNEKEIESEGQGSIVSSLKVGTTTFRIMPPYSERGIWYRKVHEYVIPAGGQWLYFPSPRDYGEKDPIWEYCEQVYENGDAEEIKALRDKNLRPSVRYLLNVFVLSEPNPVDRKDISVVKVPKKVFMEIKALDVDTGTGYSDITNLTSGVNINVKKEGQGTSTTYTVSPHRNSSDIAQLLKEKNLDLNSMTLQNLDTVYPTKTYDELVEILNTIISSQPEKVKLSEKNEAKKTTIKAESEVPVPEVELEIEAPPKEDE